MDFGYQGLVHRALSLITVPNPLEKSFEIFLVGREHSNRAEKSLVENLELISRHALLRLKFCLRSTLLICQIMVDFEQSRVVNLDLALVDSLMNFLDIVKHGEVFVGKIH